MLQSTFCHIPRITLQSEQRFWDVGFKNWSHIARATELPVPRLHLDDVRRAVDLSFEYLEREDPHYFTRTLPTDLHWRLFPEFRRHVAYLDIETTGLAPPQDKITTIAVYDGRDIRTYVQGHNLSHFARDIRDYQVLVTYNGKCFDVPFIERSMGIRMNQVHLDLRYILHSLGYRGGLKGCERQLGIRRPDLEEVDGYFAVLLWHDYKRNRNDRALETLLAYNINDVVNLEKLIVKAYNLKIQDSPFERTHALHLPVAPRIPFTADSDVIASIRHRHGHHV